MDIILQVDEEIREITTKVTDEEKTVFSKNIKYTKRLTIVFTIIALLTGNLMCINSFVQSLLYTPDVYDESLVRFTQYEKTEFIIFFIVRNNPREKIFQCYHPLSSAHGFPLTISGIISKLFIRFSS